MCKGPPDQLFTIGRLKTNTRKQSLSLLAKCYFGFRIGPGLGLWVNAGRKPLNFLEFQNCFGGVECLIIKNFMKFDAWNFMNFFSFWDFHRNLVDFSCWTSVGLELSWSQSSLTSVSTLARSRSMLSLSVLPELKISITMPNPSKCPVVGTKKSISHKIATKWNITRQRKNIFIFYFFFKLSDHNFHTSGWIWTESGLKVGSQTFPLFQGREACWSKDFQKPCQIPLNNFLTYRNEGCPTCVWMDFFNSLKGASQKCWDTYQRWLGYGQIKPNKSSHHKPLSTRLGLANAITRVAMTIAVTISRSPITIPRFRANFFRQYFWTTNIRFSGFTKEGAKKWKITVPQTTSTKKNLFLANSAFSKHFISNFMCGISMQFWMFMFL